MIIRLRSFVLLIVLFIGFCGCSSGKKIRQQAIKDIYGQPISFLLKKNREIYYSVNGEKKIAYPGGVEFNGGNDSLSAYILSKYVNHPDYNYDEFNVNEYFFMLFDKDLNIKGIRIMHKKYAPKERPYYDSIFINALKSTAGMWRKTVENQEWYIYLHRQRVY
ncbi:hypothetical protein [Bacteroides sedimenti]|uniref:hypothetical protein n=1 Tax=Bacteroides sedimenti TaxID=2136147 RepID=UPI00334157DE